MDDRDGQIVIVDDDAFSRTVLASFLERFVPCTVIAPKDEALFSAGAAHVVQVGRDPFPRPVRLGRLLEHVRGLACADVQDAIFIGPYRFEPAGKSLSGRRERIDLTDKECELLLLLQAARGRVVTRDTLLAEVWGYVDGIDTHTLETHIYRLRQKIEPDPSSPRILLTAGDGYCLAAPPAAHESVL